MSGPQDDDDQEEIDQMECMEEGGSIDEINSCVRRRAWSSTGSQQHVVFPSNSVAAAAVNFKQNDPVMLSTIYANYPLVQSMIKYERTRKDALHKDGAKQMKSVKSSDTYFRTLLTFESRALDKIAFPWAVVTIHAIIYTVIAEVSGSAIVRNYDPNVQAWQFFFAVVINASLSFLLVFRLNRAAERFWLARLYWGDIVAKGRTLVSGILIHGSHNPHYRDQAIKWVAAFSVVAMHYLRNIKVIPVDLLAGILQKDEIERLEKIHHTPIFVADEIRLHLKQIFLVTGETPTSLAHAWSQQLTQLETLLNVLIDAVGSMERIRATPLPMVYVAHLRSILIMFLIALPYVWEGIWHWATIPVMAVAAFAMLGLDGAGQEVEAPFQKNRCNHLNMDAYCLLFLGNVQQQIQEAADREIAAS